MSDATPTLRDAIEDSWEEHMMLQEFGLLDPDQPTRHAHLLEVARRRKRDREQQRPFSPRERQIIRQNLGML